MNHSKSINYLNEIHLKWPLDELLDLLAFMQIDVSNIIVNCVRKFIDTFRIDQQKKVCGFLEETEKSNKRISSIDGEQKNKQ